MSLNPKLLTGRPRLVVSLITLVLVVLVTVVVLASRSESAFADGHGSPAACSTNTNKGGTAATSINPNDSTKGSFIFTYNAPDGLNIAGVCIKTGGGAGGQQFFPPGGHSDLLTIDGAYGDGCYNIAGLGTNIVTVTRDAKSDSGKNCKQIGHLDFDFVAPTPPPLPPPGDALVDGGSLIALDGIFLGAVQGTLSSPLHVTFSEATAPAEPLPGGALMHAHGKYYSLSGDRDVVTRNPATFILGLPVPDGVPTGNLAIALFSFDPESGQNFWVPLLGLYDEATKLLLAPFPYVSTHDQIVVIIEHPGFQSPPNPSEPPLAARLGGIAASQLVQPEFFTICWMDTQEAQLYCIEWEALIIQETLQGGFFGASPEGFYSEFQSMGYPEPHLGLVLQFINLENQADFLLC